MHTYTCIAVYWFTNHSPNTTCCLLGAIHDKLLRSDKQNSGFFQKINVRYCYSSPEKRDRLLFQCRYSSYILALCKQKLGLTDIASMNLIVEAMFLESKCKGINKVSVLARTVRSEVVWHILEGEELQDNLRN